MEIATRDIKGRDARDRIINTLGLGLSYPLRDLPVKYVPMVAVDLPASIEIPDAQAGVRYQLCNEDGNPVEDGGEAFVVEIQPGVKTILHTPPVTEDITYTILAIRKDPDTRRGLNLETYLNQLVSLQAGVNARLAVTFKPYDHQRVAEDAPHQIYVNYWDSDPFQEKVRVQISESQEGVTYQLFEQTEASCKTLKKEDALSNAWQGNKEDLTFNTRAGFNEDIRLLVKAYRTTKPEICAFLETALTVHVRPNPAVAFSVEAAILDYKATAKLSLSGVQASAAYTLFKRDLVEADYGTPETEGALEIPTPEGHSVFVKRPEPVTDWNAPTGYAPVGSFVEDGGGLSITTAGLAEDTLFVVQATKIENGERLQLDQVVAVLVRPNPAPEVGVEASPIDADSIGVVTVNGTQKGVFYQLRRDADDAPVGAPGYHYEDRRIERSRVGVDFAVEWQGEAVLLLPTGLLTQTTAFNVLATKIFTGLQAPLTGKAAIEVEAGIDRALAVAFDPYELQDADGHQIVVYYGEKVRVRISKSQDGISYKLFEDVAEEVPLSKAWKGNTGEITLYPDAGCNEDIRLKIRAFRASNPALFDYLDARLTVHVRPNPAVAFSVEAAILDYKATAKLSLTDFQASATYTLYQRDLVEADYGTPETEGALEIPTPEGHSVFVKTPETITDWDDPAGFVPVKDFSSAQAKLTTAGLREDALFVVRATKKESGERLQLDQVVAVLVRPNTTPQVDVEASPVPAGSVGVVTVNGTQKGVFYQLRHDSNNVRVGAPGYHYEDRALERTRLEVDFVVEEQGDPLLKLPTKPLQKSATFHILATKILTSLTAQLDGKATIDVQADAGG